MRLIWTTVIFNMKHVIKRGIIISLHSYDVARALSGTLIVIDVSSLKKLGAASFARLDAQVQTGPFC